MNDLKISRRAMIFGLTASGSMGGCAHVALIRDDTRASIDLGGLVVSYRRRGGTRPLVVFESGLGDGFDVWEGVISALPADRAILVYSRPGYGDSSPLADPGRERNSEEAARHLRAVLAALRERRPFILVGHSLGGLYIAKFAAMYSRMAAGLVFVDGRPPDFRASCQSAAQRFCDGSANSEPPANWPAHIQAEMRGIPRTEEIAPAAETLSGIPTTVITSTRPWPGEGGAEAFELWLEAQQRFANGFHGHRFVRAEGAGHYVHREQPALVAHEIEALIARIS